MSWQEGVDATHKTLWHGVYELYHNLLMFRLWDEKHAEQFNMTFEAAKKERNTYFSLSHELRPELTESILAYESVRLEETFDMIETFINEVYPTPAEGEQAPWFFDIVDYFSITREEINRANSTIGYLLVTEEIDLLLGDDAIAFKRVAKAPLAILTNDGMLYSAEWLLLIRNPPYFTLILISPEHSVIITPSDCRRTINPPV
jgi:hypothetical protein